MNHAAMKAVSVMIHVQVTTKGIMVEEIVRVALNVVCQKNKNYE